MTLQQLKEEARKEFDEMFPISHYYCEDSWYSCPKAQDGCANNDEGDECNCGAEIKQNKYKAFIDSLITKAYEEERSEFAKKEIERLEKIKAKDNPKKHEDYCGIKKGYICDCGLAYYYLAINEQIERFKKLL